MINVSVPVQKKILLTCGTSPLAQRVANRVLVDYEVRFASSQPIPGVLLDSGRYDQLPNCSNPAFIHELLKLALDHGVGAVLPLGEEEMILLSDSRTLFSEYNISLLTSSREQLATQQTIKQPPAALDLTMQWHDFTVGPNVLGPGLYVVNDDQEYYRCTAD